ncbi:hypothetical protein [Amycolatopsis rubida]|uniref:Uncharacterized protein n=1 Tax=Amycolatopsis rubida TaxID=112413 RepID=A0A1I5XIZ5_9PSEU|nr:hypothetical protein [Amycolatopsis rubida]SFQ31943.1 hypothetical protein SAMN05421854_110268 [Amycolatopsis rubida]
MTTSWPLTNNNGDALALLTRDNGDLDEAFVWAPPDVEHRDPSTFVTVVLDGGTRRTARSGNLAPYAPAIGEHDHPGDLGDFELWLPSCAYCDAALDAAVRRYPTGGGSLREDLICPAHPLTDRPRPHQAKFRTRNTVTAATFADDPASGLGRHLRAHERQIARAGAHPPPIPVAALSPDRQIVAVRLAKAKVENAAAELAHVAAEAIAVQLRTMFPQAAVAYVDLGGWFEDGMKAHLHAVYGPGPVPVPVWHDHVHSTGAPNDRESRAWPRCRESVESLVDLVLSAASPATAGWPHRDAVADHSAAFSSDRIYEIALPPASDRPGPQAAPEPGADSRPQYRAAVHRALRAGQIPNLAPYLTTVCPECGDDNLYAHEWTDPDADPADRSYLAIGCEGYRVINPRLVGIDSPDWQDWTTEHSA